MKLKDAIANANSIYVIQFLLIAYLEALQHRRSAIGLPEELTALPIQGLPDIRNRAARLESETAAVHAGMPDARAGQLDEMRNVFTAAAKRLDSLFGNGGAFTEAAIPRFGAHDLTDPETPLLPCSALTETSGCGAS